jgi:hypothetical protein
LGQINWDNWVIGFFAKNPNYPITQLIVLRTLVSTNTLGAFCTIADVQTCVIHNFLVEKRSFIYFKTYFFYEINCSALDIEETRKHFNAKQTEAFCVTRTCIRIVVWVYEWNTGKTEIKLLADDAIVSETAVWVSTTWDSVWFLSICVFDKSTG